MVSEVGMHTFVLDYSIFFSVGTPEPTVSMEPYVILQKGATGVLPCKYNDEASDITWTKGPQIHDAALLLVYDVSRGYWRRWGPGYDSGLYNVTNEFSLVINTAAIENDDRYFCEVLTWLQEHHSLTTQM